LYYTNKNRKHNSTHVHAYKNITTKFTSTGPTSGTAASIISMSNNQHRQQIHLYAQRLNTSAALCIEIGHYDRAISSLVKALRIHDNYVKEDTLLRIHQVPVLDGSIAYSEHISATEELTQQIAMNSSSSSSSSTENHNSLLSDDKMYGCGYIYRRPIRISIQEGQNMGPALFLIITFNLALAHHLSLTAVNGSSSNTADTSISRNTMIKKTLQLYELSNKWHIRLSKGPRHLSYDSSSMHHKHQQLKECSSEDPASAVLSIRFNLIIFNNLSHIHRLANNHSKHRQCLEHLLSTVMLALEYKARTTSNNAGDDDHHDNHHGADDCILLMDLDGLLQNASTLILQEQCAEVA
jgi:hypothetical protein